MFAFLFGGYGRVSDASWRQMATKRINNGAYVRSWRKNFAVPDHRPERQVLSSVGLRCARSEVDRDLLLVPPDRKRPH